MTKRKYKLIKELEERLDNLERILTVEEYSTAEELQTEVDSKNHMFRIKHLIDLLIFEEE